jgi:hypothetical protein
LDGSLLAMLAGSGIQKQTGSEKQSKKPLSPLGQKQ